MAEIGCSSQSRPESSLTQCTDLRRTFTHYFFFHSFVLANAWGRPGPVSFTPLSLNLVLRATSVRGAVDVLAGNRSARRPSSDFPDSLYESGWICAQKEPLEVSPTRRRLQTRAFFSRLLLQQALAQTHARETGSVPGYSCHS